MSLVTENPPGEDECMSTRLPTPPPTLKRNIPADAASSSVAPRRPKRVRGSDARSTASDGGQDVMTTKETTEGLKAQQQTSTIDISALTRHERYWYEDGSVVLRVEDTLFRLQKSQLSAQSSFFKDFFADTLRSSEHCQVAPGVVVSYRVCALEGLYVRDFEKLLKMLEDPLSTTRGPLKKNFEFLSGVARAAYHLNFMSTYEWAVEMIAPFWPSNVEAQSRKPRLSFKAAVDALQLSEDADIPDIRKAAFYYLLRRPNFGLSEEDASLLKAADYHTLTRARQYCTFAWMAVLFHLPRSKNCEDEGKALPLRASRNAAGDLPSEVPLCLTRKANNLHHKWFTLINNNDLKKHCNDPIAGFDALKMIKLADQRERERMCAACERFWRSGWEVKCTEFWDGLDGVLGLKAESESDESEEEDEDGIDEEDDGDDEVKDEDGDEEMNGDIGSVENAVVNGNAVAA